MKNLTALITNDFRNIFRDDILKVLLFVPFIMILMLQFGLPVLAKALPEVADYKFLIVAGFCLVIASFPSFIISFIMLDEKDEGIFIMYKVLPLSGIKFFTYRLGFIIIFSWFFSFLLLILQYYSIIPLIKLFFVSLLYSLLPPVLCLSTVSLAKNKIEGMSIMKFLNFIIFIPAVAFFVDMPWKYLFGIIPVFWSYRVLEVAENNFSFIISLIAGLLLHLLGLRLLFVNFLKKV